MSRYTCFVCMWRGISSSLLYPVNHTCNLFPVRSVSLVPTTPDSTSKSLLVLVFFGQFSVISDYSGLLDIFIYVVTQNLLNICPILGENTFGFASPSLKTISLSSLQPGFRHMIQTQPVRCNHMSLEQKSVRKMV